MAETEKKESRLKEDIGDGPGCLGTTIMAIMAAALVVLVLLSVFSLKKVKAWEVGLRFWNISVPGLAKQGDVDVLQPGYNVVIPYLHQMNRFDAFIKRFEMAAEYPDSKTPDTPPLRFRPARDQDFVEVFVTILYHVDIDKAKSLREHYSGNADIREKGIKAVAPQILQAHLGRIMTASQFYGMSKKKAQEIRERRKTDPEYLKDQYPSDEYLLDRTSLSYQAMEQMNKYFNGRGIEIVDVLIWDFRFKEEVEASIIATVIGNARAETESALQQAAEARAEWERLLAESYAAMDIELARGAAETIKLEAQAKNYRDEQEAKGRRLILEAQAEGKGKINQALAGRGGQVYVGLEYAESLKGIQAMVVPAGGPEGLNPLDVDQALKHMIPAGE